MRFRTMLILVLMTAAALTAQQKMTCTQMAQKWQQLQKEYKFSEMEDLSNAAVKACGMEVNPEIYHQAALIYLWTGKTDLARPIVQKIYERAKDKITQSPGAQAYGASHLMPFMLAIYAKDTRKVEEYLAAFESSIFKDQELALGYLLRTNDKRLLELYPARRSTKWEYSPLICQVYCKRNSLVKDCPCANDPYQTPLGGPFALYLDYVKGKPLPEIKKDLDAKYSEVPNLKKEIQESLGIQ